LKRTITTKKFIFYFAVFLTIIITSVWSVYHLAFSASPTPTPITPQSTEETAIKKAIEDAMQMEQPQALALLLYDTKIEKIKVSSDGKWATAWLSPVDPQTGQVVPTEPGLALVHRTEDGWKAFVPSDQLWSLVVQQMPSELISETDKANWVREAEYHAEAVSGPIHGYNLPWTGGDTLTLTQSVGHDRYTSNGSAHFAFDFAKPGYPSGMFNVLAARSGIVSRVVWSNENGNEVNANYIVLEDYSTTPTTYQLYMHLAKDSIPEALRVIGTPVQHGQFIGIADDTGVSSGNHLHFMVHTYPASYWGTSVDITFEEVTINGGRPRITSDLPYCKSSDVCDSTQTNYISQNFMTPDHIPPTGGISSQIEGQTISSQSVRLTGWAMDENSGIFSAQFQAFYSGEWHKIGSTFATENFSYDWDMCSDKVANGPVAVALSIRDKAMNQASGLPGLSHFSKNFSCPADPPACIPTDNQVALFDNSDLNGKCVVLSTGSYLTPSQLGLLGDNNAQSIKVGSKVQATLYLKNNLLGRSETFFDNDYSLIDN
jgi:murein DD-endopeptidase MepM/ murein hydrolase activator NlpD